MNSSHIFFHKFMVMLSLLAVVFTQNEMEQEISKFLGANNVLSPLCPYDDYDYYVLSVQYPRSANCEKIISQLPEKNILTLHGLWPSYINGKIMDKNCNPGPEIRIVGEKSDLFDEMRQYWRSYIHSDEDFWSHEYNRHGYCYITKYQKTDYRAFFKLTIDMFNKFSLEGLIKRAFGETSGERSVLVTEFTDAISQETNGFTFTLSCKTYQGKQYIQEIRFNFGLDLEPIRSEKSISSGNCQKDKPIYLLFN